MVQFSVWGEPIRTWGTSGSGSGQFQPGLGGIAVDSAGNVYVADYSNDRVQKFDPLGNFLLMFGGKVNQTKVGEGAPEAQQNLCTAASGDVCQGGTSGSGNGEFDWGPIGSFIAIGTGNTVYLGDEKRIQIFNSDGTFKENQPDPDGAIAKGTVTGLSITLGSLFLSQAGKADVTKLNGAGKVQCTMKAASPTAVASAPGFVYVVDASGGPRVRQFLVSSCAEFDEPFGLGEITNSTGIATGAACLSSGTDIYVTNTSPAFVRAFGPTPNKLEICPKPEVAPEIVAQYALSVASFTATVRAEINPHFYADTAYYVEYATAACVDGGGWEASCVQQKPGPPGNILAAAGDVPGNSAGILLSGLSADTEYRFRFIAQSGGGGPTIGDERTFHTFLEPTVGSVSCANEVFRTGASALLPDCRAYEMVSPIDKEGADIQSPLTTIENPTARNQSAISGDKLAYTAEQRFGDAISQPYTSQYIATRTAGGWQTHGISPPRGVLFGGILVGQDSEYKAFSDDLCLAWLSADETTAPPLTSDGRKGASNFYRRNNCGGDSYEALGWGQVDAFRPIEALGASADGSRVIFRTEAHLTQDLGFPVGMEPRCQTPTAAATIAFQWLRDGTPIPGKTTVSYKTEAADAGKAIQCRVTATNPSGGATQVANPAWIIAPYPVTIPPDAPESIAAPASSAPLTVGGAGGQALSCNPNADAWGGSPTFSYRWYRNGAEIAGATSSTYDVSAADLASPAAFQCEAIATNAGASVANTSENLTTTPAPSGPVAPKVEARSSAAGPSDAQGPVTYLTENGGRRLVCALPNGTAARGCTAGTLGSSGGYEGSLQNAISADGTRVYWSPTSVFEGPSQLYLRQNANQPQSAINGEGECTEFTKACTVAVSEGSAQFWGASSDGERAIYRLGSLTETGKLFEFDASTGASTEIADGVSGQLGLSKDASRVYFASTEVLSDEPNSEDDLPQAGEANLYLYEAGAGDFEFIATLPEDDVRAGAGVRHPSPISLLPVGHWARVSPDGGATAFVSTGSLTGYDNLDATSGEADTEVFRYEASSGRLDCVSCNPSGGRPEGKFITEEAKQYWAAAQIKPAQHQLYYSRVLSDDGRRLYFESYEALVLVDTNGTRDVYQWEAVGKGGCVEASTAFSPSAGGCINLISSGKSPQDSEFADASPSGNDVFIRTGSSLVSSDPGSIDLYDARVGGGFPQPEPSPPCEGDACQSPASAPNHPTPASSTFQRIAQPSTRCPKGKRRVVRKGKARCVKKQRKGSQRKRASNKSGRAGR